MSERRAMEAAHIATAASTSVALAWEPLCFYWYPYEILTRY